MTLKMAAKVDNGDKAYFESEIAAARRPVGRVHRRNREAEKGGIPRRCRALLFPIDWPEPFGLVMIEAMACGTPVIAFNRGSVPEVIDHGKSGFLVAIDRGGGRRGRPIPRASAAAVRQCFERRFTARRMAADYLELFSTAIGRQRADRLEPRLLAD